MNALNPSQRIEQSLQTTRKAFFIAGFCLASWAPFIPLVKERLQVGDGIMGAMLLAFGVGSLLMMPISGMLASRCGCRLIFTTALMVSLVIFPALILLKQVPLISAALFIFGAGIGAMDVVANIHAVTAEKHARKPVMSGFHAFFSLGGIAGAGLVSALLAWGVQPVYIVTFVIVTLSIVMVMTWSGFLTETEKRDTPYLVKPKGGVIILGALCSIAYIMEGSILDWSGIFLATEHSIDVHLAGLGYTLFAVTMTTGRLLGDKSIILLGVRRVFLISTLLATSGFILLTASSVFLVTALSFLFIGLGVSNIAPMLFTASGRQKDMPEYLAVAAVSTLGYSGILLGPALLGGIAHIASLTASFIFIVLISILLLVFSQRVKL